MADELAKRDQNGISSVLGLTNDQLRELRNLLVDPTSQRLLVDALISAGSAVIVGQLTLAGNGQVSVDNTAGGTVVVAADTGTVMVQITNQGSVACYVGQGTVSAANGFYLAPGESIALPTQTAIKAITASSSTTIGYLRYE